MQMQSSVVLVPIVHPTRFYKPVKSWKQKTRGNEPWAKRNRRYSQNRVVAMA